VTRGTRRRDLSISPQHPRLLRRLIGVLPQADVVRGRLDRARKRVRLLDLALDAVEEDTAIGGGILAGALAYRLFLFLLPLGFLLVALLGLVADVAGSTPRTVGKDIGMLGLVTQDVAQSADGGAGVWIALSAVVILGYTTRVLYRSAAIVHALAWDHSATSARSGSRSLKLFALGVAAQVVLGVVVSVLHAHTQIGAVFASVGLAVGVMGVWLGTSLLLPHSTARWTDLLPGSALYGIGILVVHAFNLYVLEFVHRSRSHTYGTLGTASTFLLSLFFIGRLIVAAAVLNATVLERRTRSSAPAGLTER
jgi:membrane protein